MSSMFVLKEAVADAAAAQAAVDAVELKTDHLAIVAGDLAVDIDLVPATDGVQALGATGKAWAPSIIQAVDPV